MIDQKKLCTVISVSGGDAIGIAVADFDDLVAEVRKKFGDYRGDVKLYRDTGAPVGTRVVDNNYFESLPSDIVLYFAKDGEVFAPVKNYPPRTYQAHFQRESIRITEGINNSNIRLRR